MKRAKYNILIMAALAILLGSCEKSYLDTVPTDQVSSESAFTTTTNAMQALNGIHRMMFQQHNSRQDQSGEGGINIYRDMMGEDQVTDGITTSTSGLITEIYNQLQIMRHGISITGLLPMPI